jgi:hypothetical protein
MLQMQHLSQLSEELLGDLQNWGFNLCSRSTARMCLSFFKFTIPTNCETDLERKNKQVHNSRGFRY